MKERKIILGVEGKDKNVIVLSPPLCFTTDNARYIVQHFSEVLANIESEAARWGLYVNQITNTVILAPLWDFFCVIIFMFY